jgi:hypothetical protein
MNKHELPEKDTCGHSLRIDNDDLPASNALHHTNMEAFTTVAHQFAPTGHALHFVEHSGTYQAMRWGHIRDFATLDDARKFLVQIGGRHA